MVAVQLGIIKITQCKKTSVDEKVVWFGAVQRVYPISLVMHRNIKLRVL